MRSIDDLGVSWRAYGQRSTFSSGERKAFRKIRGGALLKECQLFRTAF